MAVSGNMEHGSWFTRADPTPSLGWGSFWVLTRVIP